MNLNCHQCKRDFTANINIATITTFCPVCGAYNHISQALGRYYGKAVGDKAKVIFDALSNAGNYKDADIRKQIIEAGRRVNLLIQEAGCLT